MLHLLHLASPLAHFARAGGGGSSSGGGGGGGGSLIAAIGFVPAHLTTRWCMRHYSQRVAMTVGVIVAVVVSVPTFWLGFLFGLIVAVGAAAGVHSGLNDWWGKLKNRVKIGKKNMDFAASADPVWQSEVVQQRVRQVFFDYQKDWSDFNVQHMQSYMHIRYYQHAQLMMAALYQMGRRNVVADPKIYSVTPVDVLDSSNDDNDAFSMLIRAQANDQLIDTTTGKVIYTDKSAFAELWWFDRNGNNWNLEHIDQVTANSDIRESALEHFARENNMFYSLDWGWLLLPQRGQLFGQANFKNSDINNHVIGNWNGLVVQMYTYVPAHKAAENYLIAQLVLPKSYGGILVQRRKSLDWWQKWFGWIPRGYKRISMEWPDFNATWYMRPMSIK